MRIILALAAFSVVGACTSSDGQLRLVTNEEFLVVEERFIANVQMDLDETYSDTPFDSGPVYVVANEHGDLHTYSLTPCSGGTRICGGNGRVGRVERTTEYFVVTGAYRDRTFYLSPGGDGYLSWRGVERDLAWN